MASPTKIEVINRAFEEIRISGLTVNPIPSDIVAALDRLEDMMAEYFTNYSFNIGYNFEETPDVNSPTEVTRNYSAMMKTNLAVRLIAMFNKQVPASLVSLAKSSFSSSLSQYKAATARQVQPPRRMPKGSGNTIRQIYLTRFQIPVDLPPTQASNNIIKEGETKDYQESFDAWLGGNTIASFTITSDPRIQINSSTNNDPIIDYNVTALDNSSYGPWQYVQITVTDNTGRVEIRLINFIIQEVPNVPGP